MTILPAPAVNTMETITAKAYRVVKPSSIRASKKKNGGCSLSQHEAARVQKSRDAIHVHGKINGDQLLSDLNGK